MAETKSVSVLNINGLSKTYGRVRAVDGLELRVDRGAVFGILGPNGSGKTTTLGMVLGVINPTGGNFSWFEGQNGAEVRKRIGAILESPAFYHYLTAVQNLRIVARIKGVPFTRIDDVLRRVGLYERKDHKFKTYSLGMKQRLAIASALLADPEIMILDEPTNGLDPAGIADIRQLIIDLAYEGRTIIIASHLLDEVQRICTDFAVLSKGRKIYQGKVKELSAENARVEVMAEDEEHLWQELEACPLVVNARRETTSFIALMDEGKDAGDLNAFLTARNITVNHLLSRHSTLEERFLDILKAEQNG